MSMTQGSQVIRFDTAVVPEKEDLEEVASKLVRFVSIFSPRARLIADLGV